MIYVFLNHLLALIIIINPLSKLFIFDQLANDLTEKQRGKKANESAIAMFIIMILAVWLGVYFLRFFGIKIGDFNIAGGILIFYSGFTLMYEGKIKIDNMKTFSVVPFGFPITIGPGALSAIILFSTNYSTFNYKGY